MLGNCTFNCLKPPKVFDWLKSQCLWWASVENSWSVMLCSPHPNQSPFVASSAGLDHETALFWIIFLMFWVICVFFHPNNWTQVKLRSKSRTWTWGGNWLAPGSLYYYVQFIWEANHVAKRHVLFSSFDHFDQFQWLVCVWLKVGHPKISCSTIIPTLTWT